MLILYVEDNALLQHLIKETLELEGWHVELCPTGFDALERLDSQQHYDLIITDCDLPGVDGIYLIRYAHSIPFRRQVPIIVFTAREREREAFSAGASLYLRKPADTNRMVESIKYLCGLTLGQS